MFKLNDYQCKTNIYSCLQFIVYSYRSTYTNPWQPQIKNLQQIQKNQREKNKCIPLNKNIKTQRKRLKDTKNKELLIQKQPENKKKKMAVNTYLSIITLNVNELDALIKRAFMAADWIQKNKTHLQVAYKRLTSELNTHKNESEGMEKYIMQTKMTRNQGQQSSYWVSQVVQW